MTFVVPVVCGKRSFLKLLGVLGQDSVVLFYEDMEEKGHLSVCRYDVLTFKQ